MNSSDQAVYIVGVGRSGTSLLMTLLNGHSQIAFTPETHFLRFYLGSEAIRQQWEKRGPAVFQKALENDSYFQRLKISAANLLAAYQAPGTFDLHEVYRDLLRRYLRRKGKQMIGDKDPRYIDYLEVLQQIYPQAKIIHIYRDPRDVTLSKMKAAWSAHRPYWMNAIISQMQITRGRDLGPQLFGDQYYELSYESLVTQPETTLTQLLAFLGYDYEASMLDLRASAEELVDPSEWQWKDNTFKPLLAENLEKWRRKLSPFQVRCIEVICKEWFQRLDYQVSEKKVGLLQENLLRSVFAFEGLQRLVYDRQLKAQMKKALAQISE
ncbi:MAG: sulfotransferase [Bacteroidota bacterium]